MSKEEIMKMIEMLQKEADKISSNENPQPEESFTEDGNEPVVNENDEVEEQKQIEPQTNGEITDDIPYKEDAKAGITEEPSGESTSVAGEVVGFEDMLANNFDERWATIQSNYDILKAEQDKMKVALSEILTRIELVQNVTDKVTTIDHDTLLTESIKLLV